MDAKGKCAHDQHFPVLLLYPCSLLMSVESLTVAQQIVALDTRYNTVRSLPSQQNSENGDNAMSVDCIMSCM